MIAHQIVYENDTLVMQQLIASWASGMSLLLAQAACNEMKCLSCCTSNCVNLDQTIEYNFMLW